MEGSSSANRVSIERASIIKANATREPQNLQPIFIHSGNMQRPEFDPTYYRNPQDYLNIFSQISITKNGKTYGVEVLQSNAVQSYIKVRELNKQLK